MRQCWGDGILYHEPDGMVHKTEVVEHSGWWVPPQLLATQAAAAAAATNSSSPSTLKVRTAPSAIAPLISGTQQQKVPLQQHVQEIVEAEGGPDYDADVLAAAGDNVDGSVLAPPESPLGITLLPPNELGPSPQSASDLALAALMIDMNGIKVEAVQPALWNLDRIDQRQPPLDQRYLYGTPKTQGTGKGVTIYAVDSGVRASHQEFRQWHGTDSRASFGYDFVDNDMDASDCDGHGTHVSATAIGRSVGVAKEAKVVAVRVLDCNGSGSISNVVAGLDWVAAHASKPAIVIMSLGVTGGSWARSLEEAVKSLLHDQGITVIVASGNSASDSCAVSPANVLGVITVAASNLEHKFGTTPDGGHQSGNGLETILIEASSLPSTLAMLGRYKWSNTGSCVTLFAPGVEIYSACGGASRCPVVNDIAYTWASGTSMAVPHVAGTAAIYLANHPAALPQEVAEAIVRSSTPDTVVDSRMRSGTPNRMLFSLGVQGEAAEVKAADGVGR